MRKDNDSFDKAIDMLITEAAIIADEDIGNSIEEPEEEVIFSKRHEENMKKLFNEMTPKAKRRVPRWTKLCACIVVLVMIFSAVSIFSVSAWRIKIFNFVMEIGKPNTDYDFNDNEGSSYADDEISMEYIPDGFELVKNTSHQNIKFLEFRYENQYFTVTIENVTGKSSVDTENGIQEDLKINGYDAVYTTNENVNTVIWSDDEYSYTVYGNISKEELIRIAENINR